MNKSDTSNSQEFKSLYNEYFKNWGVTFDDREYVEAISDEKIADTIASKLNKILHNEEIYNSLNECHERPDKLAIAFNKSDRLMKQNLIVKVHGATSELEGVCKECLKFYEKDSKYKELKAKLELFKNPCEDTH